MTAKRANRRQTDVISTQDRCKTAAKPLQTALTGGKNGCLSLAVRHYLTVTDVLKLYPTRRKSWAYKQLQLVRDSTAQEFATVRDFAEHVGLSECELRSLLWPDKGEK